MKAINDPPTLTDTKIIPANKIKKPEIIIPKEAQNSSLLNIRSSTHFPIKQINSKKIIFNRRLKNKKNMTICIATICDADKANPKIVFASDRLVTDEDGYTFEIGVPKAGRLSTNCYIMEAGNAFRAQRVLDRFNSKHITSELDQMSILQIVDAFSNTFKEVHSEALEDEIFNPRGINRKEFYENFSKYPAWFSLMIDNQVRNFDFGVNLIFMGFDIDQNEQIGKAHIYKITDSGEPDNYSQLGFAMIGIGEKLSLPEYTQDTYSPNNPLEDAMVRTYWAKRTSERMTGVGSTTDFGIIWLQKEDEKTDIHAQDATLQADIIKQYLDLPFENTRKEIAKMQVGIKSELLKIINPKQD